MHAISQGNITAIDFLLECKGEEYALLEPMMMSLVHMIKQRVANVDEPFGQVTKAIIDAFGKELAGRIVFYDVEGNVLQHDDDGIREVAGALYKRILDNLS